MRVTIDYPPVWLALLAAVAFALGRIWPHGPDLVAAGWVLLAAAGVAMVWAGAQILARRSTLDPHGQPRALVTRGIYRWSRNPIYLADAIALAGFALLFRAPLALLLVPVFVAIIDRRFIRNEEARLLALFGSDYRDYMRRTRRWFGARRPV